MRASQDQPERARDRIAPTDAQVHRPTMDRSRTERPALQPPVFAIRLAFDKGVWRSAVALLCVLAPLLVLFAPAWNGDAALALRDGEHYYWPLWNWIQRTWNAGEAPFWNPHENTGSSLLADPTATLWYPGQLIFRLPISFAASYHLYLAAHYAWAAAGTFYAARREHLSRLAASLAAASYLYGGAVLFLYSNPIYLVGASWLPWGWIVARQTARRLQAGPTTYAPISLALILALMTLGGDPQMAVHLALLSFVVCGFPFDAFTATHTAASSAEEVVESPHSARGNQVLRAAVAVVAAALLASGLAAIQILPTLETLRESGRTQPSDTRFDFSVGPWRWCEILWPNAGGRMFPQHRRWMSALPAEGRVWTPSLYGGAAIGVLAISVALSDRRNRRIRLLVLITLFAIVAACGQYGLGWLLAELRAWSRGGADSTNLTFAAPVGGLYWLIDRCLPGYGAFRYPAKWWPIAAFTISLLAASGWDRLFAQVSTPPSTASHDRSPAPNSMSRTVARLALLLLAINLAITSAIIVPPSLPAARLATASDWFGPFDLAGARGDLFVTLASSTVSFLGLLLCSVRADIRRIGIPLLLGWSIVEVPLANAWLCQWLPLDVIAAASDDRPNSTSSVDSGERIYRESSDEWWPQTWETSASSNRLIETAQWQRATLFPKTNLLVPRTVLSREDGWSVRLHRQLFDEADAADAVDAWLDVLSARSRLLPANTAPQNGGVPYTAQQIARPDALPNAWFVERVEWSDGVAEAVDVSARRRVFQDESGQPRDFRRSALIVGRPSDAFAVDAGDKPSEDRDVGTIESITRIAPGRTTMAVQTTRPAWLVFNDAYAPGWRATGVERRSGERRELPVLRANGVMRAIVVPSGEWDLEWTYAPASWRFGRLISLGTLLGLTAVAVRRGKAWYRAA